jgi:hypothetical protein
LRIHRRESSTGPERGMMKGREAVEAEADAVKMACAMRAGTWDGTLARVSAAAAATAAGEGWEEDARDIAAREEDMSEVREDSGRRGGAAGPERESEAPNMSLW